MIPRPPSGARRARPSAPEKAPATSAGSEGGAAAAATGERDAMVVALEADLYRVQSRSERLLRDLERQSTGRGQSRPMTSRRRGELDAAKRSAADVQSVLSEARTPAEERLALLELLVRRLDALGGVALMATDDPSAGFFSDPDAAGRAGSSRAGTYLALVDRTLALSQLRGRSERDEDVPGHKGRSAESREQGEDCRGHNGMDDYDDDNNNNNNDDDDGSDRESAHLALRLAPLVRQTVHQAGQLSSETGVPFAPPSSADLGAALEWCVAQISLARGGAGLGALRAALQRAEERAAAAEASSASHRDATHRAEAALQQARAALDQQRSAADHAAADAAQVRADAAARAAERDAAARDLGAALESRAASETRLLRRAEAAERALAAAEAALESAQDRSNEAVDELSREADAREQELSVRLASREAELARADARAAELELRLSELSGLAAGAEEDEQLSRESAVPDGLRDEVASLRRSLDRIVSGGAAPDRDTASVVAAVAESVARQLAAAEQGALQLASLRAAEAARARREARQARLERDDARQLADNLERTHQERFASLLAGASRSGPDSVPFEEALREEMASMRAAFELKLNVARAQVARLSAENGRLHHDIELRGPDSKRTAAAASHAHRGGGSGGEQ